MAWGAWAMAADLAVFPEVVLGECRAVLDAEERWGEGSLLGRALRRCQAAGWDRGCPFPLALVGVWSALGRSWCQQGLGPWSRLRRAFRRAP